MAEVADTAGDVLTALGGSATEEEILDATIDFSARELAAAAAANAGGGAGSGVPDGGTTGEVLVKESDADGDAGWVDPALPSNDTPLPPSGSGSPGVATTWMRSDAYPPASSVALLDASIICGANPATAGDVFSNPWNSATAGLAASGRGQGTPYRFVSSATYKLGVTVTTAGGTGCVVRIGVFADDARGIKAGTLVADLGTIDATGTGTKYASGTFAADNSTRYWILCIEQGGAASHASLQCGNVQAAIYSNGPATSLRYTGIAGALADNPTVTTFDSNVFPILILAQVQ